MNYKLSKYNFIFQKDNANYIYNILSTAILKLNDEYYEKFINFDEKLFSCDEIQFLAEQGFVVGCCEHETEKYVYYYENARYSATENVFALAFIPTYDCNLRCPYCYEGQSKSNFRISPDAVDAIIRFYKKQIESSQDGAPIKSSDILLYGGEPMLCKDALYAFCEGINSVSQQYNIPTQFSMTSNLTLLDDKTIELIKKYNILTQVSIDGTKAQHDVRRIFPNNSGSYEIILSNLKKLKEAGLKSNVVIRLNTDAENIEQMYDTMLNIRQFSDDIYFGLLSEYKGRNEEALTYIKPSCRGALLIDTHKFYRKLGMSIPQKFGKRGPCSINCKNKYMVDCYLDVYKCDLLLGKKECSVGKISGDGEIIFNENYYRQMSYTPVHREKCLNCHYLPLCGGGCPATYYLNAQKSDGVLNETDCLFDQEKLQACLEDYVETE